MKLKVPSKPMQNAELIKEVEAKKHSILLHDKEDDNYYIPRRNEKLLKKYGIFAPNFESTTIELVNSVNPSETLKK